QVQGSPFTVTMNTVPIRHWELFFLCYRRGNSRDPKLGNGNEYDVDLAVYFVIRCTEPNYSGIHWYLLKCAKDM
ncbi:MAG: hypothetical protein KAQ79_19720, partial [Cyclobacteriaceae bacterium]|nr:hypothetical protein [Cyclobacteriaceae bacterium]